MGRKTKTSAQIAKNVQSKQTEAESAVPPGKPSPNPVTELAKHKEVEHKASKELEPEKALNPPQQPPVEHHDMQEILDDEMEEIVQEPHVTAIHNAVASNIPQVPDLEGTLWIADLTLEPPQNNLIVDP